MSLHYLCRCGTLMPKPGNCGCRDRARGGSTARGYDNQHQRRRNQLIPLAHGTPCPMCNELMLKGQALALDHTTPLSIDKTSRGDRIVHSSCNNRAGGFLKGAIPDPSPKFGETHSGTPSVG